MLKKKQVTALALAGLLTFGVSGCGNKEEKKEYETLTSYRNYELVLDSLKDNYNTGVKNDINLSDLVVVRTTNENGEIYNFITTRNVTELNELYNYKYLFKNNLCSDEKHLSMKKGYNISYISVFEGTEVLMEMLIESFLDCSDVFRDYSIYYNVYLFPSSSMCIKAMYYADSGKVRGYYKENDDINNVEVKSFISVISPEDVKEFYTIDDLESIQAKLNKESVQKVLTKD